MPTGSVPVRVPLSSASGCSCVFVSGGRPELCFLTTQSLQTNLHVGTLSVFSYHNVSFFSWNDGYSGPWSSQVRQGVFGGVLCCTTPASKQKYTIAYSSIWFQSAFQHCPGFCVLTGRRIKAPNQRRWEQSGCHGNAICFLYQLVN